MKTYIKPVATIADIDLRKFLNTTVGSGGGYTDGYQPGGFTKKNDGWEDDYEDDW